MRRLAIIPARGGSKRIPRKNIKDFCGKPMIAWSIQAALRSGCFEEVIVSTDDPEIVEIAQRYGASVPFLRPAALSDDFTGTSRVVRHALEWMIKEDGDVDFACCLYATAPFVASTDLQKGWEILKEQGCSYAFSVTSYAFPIQRAIRILEDGGVKMFQPQHLDSRSQDLEEAWHDAGQFYWGTTQAWLDELPIFSEHSLPVRLPRQRVQDIDTPEDWQYAESMFRILETKDET